MKHVKNDVLSVEKSKVNLKMDFNVNDVIDILVSEQEQNLENHIKNLEYDVKQEEEKLSKCNDEIDASMKKFVNTKYKDKMDAIENTFKSMGLNAKVNFEIIDGKDMPGPSSHRPVLTTSQDRQLSDEVEKIVVALVICNKDFDRNTVDNAVSFYIESEYDDELKVLNVKHDELLQTIKNIRQNIKEANTQLNSADRLVRRAKAVVTKKVIGENVDELIKDFRQQYPQIQLKQIANG